MKAFVTGATGFLGGRLTQKLLARGDEVVALVRRGTENVLEAAANIERVVYVSTVNVFGNARGTVVDETYERTPGDWLSDYDWTEITRLGDMIDRVSPRPARLTLPTALLRLGHRPEPARADRRRRRRHLQGDGREGGPGARVSPTRPESWVSLGQ